MEPPTIIEIIGTSTGIANAILAYRNSVWMWPVGLIPPVAFGILFWQHRLYADMALNGFYFVSSLVGWGNWLIGGPKRSALPVTSLSIRQTGIFAGGVVIVAAISAIALRHLTDAASPWWDSLATTASICAQLLLVRRKIETWYFANFANAILVVLCFERALYFTAALNLGLFLFNFLIIAAWKRERAKAAIRREFGTMTKIPA